MKNKKTTKSFPPIVFIRSDITTEVKTEGVLMAPMPEEMGKALEYARTEGKDVVAIELHKKKEGDVSSYRIGFALRPISEDKTEKLIGLDGKAL